MKHQSLVFGLIIVVASALVIYFAVNGSQTTPNNTPEPALVQSSVVELTEYGDFQCPACRSYYPLVKQLKTEFGEKLKLTYKHFPLPQHANAEESAGAAEAAGNQGKFFEMHDLLYDNQEQWARVSNPLNLFKSYAQSLNLDLERWQKDYQSKEVRDKIRQDLNAGKKLGVNATPTFFVNGQKITNNPQSYEEFKNLINKALLP